MNSKKIILGILIFVLIISAVVISNLYLRESKDYLLDTSDNYEVTIYDLTLEEMGLTDEQYQLLVDSILPESLEQMSVIRRRNAWLILDMMVEIDFVESTAPGQSRVGYATWILDVLGVGEIEELDIALLSQDALTIRIVNEDDEIYYLRYPRSSLLSRVTRDSEDGEILYEGQIHAVRDGRLCEREYARGPIVRCDGDDE